VSTPRTEADIAAALDGVVVTLARAFANEGALGVAVIVVWPPSMFCARASKASVTLPWAKLLRRLARGFGACDDDDGDPMVTSREILQ
jgi:hypothetical protein